MLTFRKGGYSKDELYILYDALIDARSSLHCAESGCDYCINRKPCADICRCCEYVGKLLNQPEKPKA